MSVWVCILSCYPEMSRLLIKCLYGKEKDVNSFTIFLGENCEIWNFFLLHFKKGKTHASRLSCLIVCTFLWLLNPTNCFFPSDLLPLSVCSATPRIVLVFLCACHEHSRNDPEPCAFVTQPLAAARKPQFVMLWCCSLTLYCVSLC